MTRQPFGAGQSDDGSVLRAAAAGDMAALERFYEDHVDGLYAFVYYRAGGDPTLAEDIVQDTFAAALDRLEDYDPGRGTASSWLCTLSRNVIRRHLRHHRRGEELTVMWDRIDRSLVAVFEALDGQPLSDELVEREETRNLVGATIANLPDRYRKALEVKYLAGGTMAELATRLEISEEAAKSLLARARRAFRDAFLTLTRSFAEVQS